jgi:hypothetical protein
VLAPVGSVGDAYDNALVREPRRQLRRELIADRV